MLRTLRTAPVVCSASLTTQVRGVKPKKKNKAGPKFIKDSQQWRQEWRETRELQLANSLRNYMQFSSTKRQVPFDTRFKPFDRDENDGVYIVMKHLMDDKLALANNHARPVKCLMCNVGLLGPTVTTEARWKPRSAANLSAKEKLLSGVFEKEKDISNMGYQD